MGGQSDLLKKLRAQAEAWDNAVYDNMVSSFSAPPPDNYAPPNKNFNAGIQPQYTRQAPSGGLVGGGALSPMSMYQNRNAYQNQYGTPESLAPMQALNQYRQGNQSTPGTAPTGAGPSTTGGK